MVRGAESTFDFELVIEVGTEPVAEVGAEVGAEVVFDREVIRFVEGALRSDDRLTVACRCLLAEAGFALRVGRCVSAPAMRLRSASRAVRFVRSRPRCPSLLACAPDMARRLGWLFPLRMAWSRFLVLCSSACRCWGFR